jgi:hypothetical protein
VKDLATQTLLLRCNSDGDLYPFHGSTPSTQAAFCPTGGDLWHRRIGHPSTSSISHFPLDSLTHVIITPLVAHPFVRLAN